MGQASDSISLAPYFDPETAAGFLQSVFAGVDGGYVAISYKGSNGFNTTAFPAGEWEKITSFSESKSDMDLYFALGLLGTSPKRGQRGKIDDVVAIPGLWLDIDCAEGQHSAANLPTFEEAELKLLTAFPTPSILVHSGGGLHAYWLFPELASTKDKVERETIKKLSERFQKAFIRFAKETNGWKLDNTSDLARVLRIPGSMNHKNKETIKPVTILEASDQRYSIQELETAICKLESQVAPEQQPVSIAVTKDRKALLVPMLKGCAVLRHFKKNAHRLSEAEWYDMTGLVSRTEEGPAEAHEWSKKDPRYSYEETEAKIQHALRDAGPATCRKLQEKHGMELCEGCPLLNQINSPINIGWEASKEEDRTQAVQIIEEAAEKTKEDAGAALEPAVIDQLVFLENTYLADYERMKQLLVKSGVSSRTLQTAIRKQKAKYQRHEKKEYSPGSPLDQWETRDNVLYKRESSNRWGTTLKPISRTAPEIKKVLTNEQDGQEYWEIGFQTVRGRYITVTVPRAKMATKKGAIEELSRYGFDVKESTARDVIDYLHDYDAANAEALPTQKFLERFGWTEDFESFVIGSDVIGRQDITYQAPGDGEKQLAEAFRTRGTLDDWKALIPLLSGRNWALFKLFQAFLPPLLPILETNGYTFSNHGESSQGKTLSDSIAGSVWGNINYNANGESLIVQGMNITSDKLEKTLSMMRHIPVFLQDVHETRPEVIVNAIHNVELGKAKGRGHNSNGSQASRTIKTVLFLTSEAPLSSMSENGGVFARAIEFSGSAFQKHSPVFKEQVMTIIFENYGHAGRTFVEHLLANRERWDEWRKAFREGIADTMKQLEDGAPGMDTKLTRKIPYFVAVQVAARIASEALDLAITPSEIDALVADVATDQVTKTESTPYYEKAMDALRDWVAVNKTKLWVVGETRNDADGKHGIIGLWNVSKGFMAMTRSEVNDILQKRGFDLKRCVNEWKDVGYLETDSQGKTSVSTYLPHTGDRAKMLRIPIANIVSGREVGE
ncbi:DUF927 domain-containing protein [Exiguobacterium sp. s168]|uniref:DUF927 domain-containing protein n=1 Tax=Exiguobacterium sp. s168 TaxID=2751194 RepID=UPI001BE7DBDD|nr:DUF927 domain-containing protein [Exiguobacterium sp. s168]